MKMLPDFQKTMAYLTHFCFIGWLLNDRGKLVTQADTTVRFSIYRLHIFLPRSGIKLQIRMIAYWRGNICAIQFSMVTSASKINFF